MSDPAAPDSPTIAWDETASCLRVIDQRALPHRLIVTALRSVDDVITAIREMWVRGAPLIGATGAYGAHFAWREAGAHGADWVRSRVDDIRSARPTAVNLAWAVDRVMRRAMAETDPADRPAAALAEAQEIVREERDRSRKIGEHGVALIEKIAARKSGAPVNILTHCNAGRLATVDYGTATAPIYLAAERGVPVHVWVDETRPRNQGAALTAWELSMRRVPCTVVVDSAGGYLMQSGRVDLVLVGTDRTTRNGDVVNKIGTYLKALAARDNDVPFYVALPSSSIDWALGSGHEVRIEERDATEVDRVFGLDENGAMNSVQITPQGSHAANYAFDVTPANLVTGLITERGICAATGRSLKAMFSEER